MQLISFVHSSSLHCGHLFPCTSTQPEVRCNVIFNSCFLELTALIVIFVLKPFGGIGGTWLSDWQAIFSVFPPATITSSVQFVEKFGSLPKLLCAQLMYLKNITCLASGRISIGTGKVHCFGSFFTSIKGSHCPFILAIAMIEYCTHNLILFHICEKKV